MKYLVIIPARGGSKGIVDKNLHPFADKPLIRWSISHALECDSIDKVVVSTDSKNIADEAIDSGAEVPFMRPDDLSGDLTTTESVLLHALKQLETKSYKPDAVVLLQPTSPYRRKGSLQKAINLFEAKEADSLVSVCETHSFFWKNIDSPKASYDYLNRPRRQDITGDERTFRENGSIYITKVDILKNTECRLGGSILLFEMSEVESQEIDVPTDILIAEALMLHDQK